MDSYVLMRVEKITKPHFHSAPGKCQHVGWFHCRGRMLETEALLHGYCDENEHNHLGSILAQPRPDSQRMSGRSRGQGPLTLDHICRVPGQGAFCLGLSESRPTVPKRRACQPRSQCPPVPPSSPPPSSPWPCAHSQSQPHSSSHSHPHPGTPPALPSAQECGAFASAGKTQHPTALVVNDCSTWGLLMWERREQGMGPRRGAGRQGACSKHEG